MAVSNDYRVLARSTRRPARGANRLKAADPTDTLSVTIRTRRRPDGPAFAPPSGRAPRPPLSREAFAERFGADEHDLALIDSFAASHGLQVVERSVARRSVRLSGTVAQMQAAFDVQLGIYQTPSEVYRGREGEVSLPSGLAGIVEGVFGLDDRRMARPGFVRPAKASQALAPLTPPQVAGLYGFPTTSTGTGQTIGLLEFGGGYQPSDIAAFFTGLNLATPTLTDIGIDGATNSPGGGDDVEVALDIDVAGSVAPGASIAVYFAPWSEQGWVDAVTTAVHDATNRPSVLSISWGWPENETINGLTWSQAAIDAVSATFEEAALLGVTILVASGDHGSDCGIGDDRAHVLYPASDPWVTACGGTSIALVPGGGFTETTWNDNGVTGGGVSDIFPSQDWQTWSNVPVSVNDQHQGRGIPDIGGNADPSSGYELVVGGQQIGPVGGTSATAPLYAGLVALMNATLDQPVGYLNYNLYTLAGGGVFNDIADNGSNATGGAPGYSAVAGWDACTGLGSVQGTTLMTALRGSGRPPGLTGFNDQMVMAWKGIEFDDRLFWTTFDGKSWATQQEIAGTASSAGPGLAVFNGLVYAAWKGAHIDQGPAGGVDDWGIWWSSFDGTNWTPQQEIAGVGTSNGPSLAVFNGELYAAWKGLLYDQGIWWSSFDGTSWSAQQEIGGVASSVGPALCVFDGLLYAAWKGASGDQGIYVSSFDGTSWSAQQLMPGTATTEGPSLAVYNGLLYAAWKGASDDQGLYWSGFDGTGWAPQQNIVGVASSVGPALTAFNNLLYATWKGAGGDQTIWVSSFDGTSWAPQQQIQQVGGTSPDLLKTLA